MMSSSLTYIHVCRSVVVTDQWMWRVSVLIALLRMRGRRPKEEVLAFDINVMTSCANYGVWTQKNTLGRGSFGKVTLWQNQHTHEYLALKVNEDKVALSKQLSARWSDEIKLLREFKRKHRGIVEICDVPQDLQRYVEEQATARVGRMLAPIAMEYCEGGSLREVLQQAENICGLCEFQVRAIAHDIGGAIEYLHDKKVMHRDLKPENIVLKKDDTGKIAYKLTDFGVAKHLCDTDTVNSHVGTFQYLAPEYTGEYSYPFDLWSLGIIMFEVITGIRPFLHGDSHVKMLDCVKKKSDDDIHIYKDGSQDKYSPCLPSPHQLSECTARVFERWLRCLLHLDPKKRGSSLNAQAANSFLYLHKILAMKLLRVVSLYNGREATYSLPASGLHDIMPLIATEPGITSNQIRFLHPDGTWVDTAQSSAALFDILPPDCDEEQIRCIYLIKKGQQEFVFERKPTSILPNGVTKLQHYWFYCREVSRSYKRLWAGQHALMLQLAKSRKHLQTLQKQAEAEIGNLRAMKSLFDRSSAFDFDKCSEQNSLESDLRSRHFAALCQAWQTRQLDFEAAFQQIVDSELDSRAFESAFKKCCKMPLKKDESHPDPLEQLTEDALQSYKRCLVDGANREEERGKLRALYAQCQNEQTRLDVEVCQHLSALHQCRLLQERHSDQLAGILEKVSQARGQLFSLQIQRQRDVWQSADSTPPRSSPIGSAAGQSLRSSRSSMAIGGPPSTSEGPGDESLLSSLHFLDEHSSQVCQNSSLIRHTMYEDTLKSLEVELEQQCSKRNSNSIDWSFLQQECGDDSFQP